MKRGGFKRLSFAEAKAKQAEAQERKNDRPATKKAVKHPTIMGVKSRRWVGIKGCLWAIFSDYIRLRDFIEYGGKCVSCNHRVEHWKDADPGHFISVTSGNFETCFAEDNVHLQCKRCNNPTWTPDASLPYRVELDRRLGKGTADKIIARSKLPAKAYSTLEYGRAITHYKEKFDILLKSL